MLNPKLAPALLLIGVTASVWACGDDDKPPPASAGKGGSAGSAGSSGKGGAGSSSGGASGKGGAGTGGATGGASGKGGTAGATGGTAGATGGTAGTVQGGMGGEGGDAGGNGGAGGEGGSGPTLQDQCASICADQTALACVDDSTCEVSCLGMAGDTLAPDEYATLVACQAANLGPSDYECVAQSGAPDMATLVGGSACETEVCAWTCADGTFVEENTYVRCGC